MINQVILGDCFEKLNDLASNSVLEIDNNVRINEAEVIRFYINEKWTLRRVASHFNTNHHKIRKILQKADVKISSKQRRAPMSEEYRRRMSESRKGRCNFKLRGRKRSLICRLKNMRTHLKYDVSLDWLSSFEDIEKLKYLNHALMRERDYIGFNCELYKQFIEKFYYNESFNKLFNKWIETKDRWIKPSLDHIIPKSKGGSLTNINNLQFVSWLENRTKVNMSQSEWNSIKANIQYYL